jgi:hypothetical protein
VILFYLSRAFDDVQQNMHFPWSENMEVDIYVPSICLAVEYDGEYWHKRIDHDTRKDRLCREHQIDIVRIREPGCPVYPKEGDATVFVTKEPASSMAYLNETLCQLFDYIYSRHDLEQTVDVDILRDYAKILDLINYSEASLSLAALFPDIAGEWHETKNGRLMPSMIMPGSSKQVWWRCAQGHEWQTTPANRTNVDNQNKCPYCQNKKAWPGFNDLCTVKPELAKEWDLEKNQDKRPEQYTVSSGKIVWWKCDKGHEWQAAIYSRSNTGCPICGNKKVLVGYNDLASQCPDLALEWDYEKNGDLRPEQFVCGSNQNVWWKCRYGHEWKAMITQRVSKHTGCPTCLNQKVLTGYNDLSVTNPELLSEWHLF